MSRFSFVLLDLTTLIETALDRQKYRTLLHSAPVTSLRRGALLLLETLDRNFPTTSDSAGDAAETSRDKQNYVTATETLTRAGIAVQPDGIERYVAARREVPTPPPRDHKARAYAFAIGRKTLDVADVVRRTK